MLTVLVRVGVAQAADPEVEFVDHTSAIFADRELPISIRVKFVSDSGARLAWELAIRERTIQSGELSLAAKDEQQLTLPLHAISLKSGIAVQAVLSVQILDEQANSLGSDQKHVWILSPDAFNTQRKAVERLQLRLFDPQGKTAKVFEEEQLPFRLLTNFQELEELSEGVLVVGEGISFEESPGLAPSLDLAMERGLSVLCLSPSEGRVSLSSLFGEVNSPPEKLSFEGPRFIGRLDKRLRSDDPHAHTDLKTSNMSFEADGQQVVARIATQQDGWPWVEASCDNPKRKLIFCGVSLIDGWNSTPTPRYLLSAIFRDLLEYTAPATH